ncbi:MAG: DcrB-related protein [Polyangiaceae bacterium]
MAVFHANEFLTNLPDGLKDKTVHIFALTEEGPSDLSIVVTRDAKKGGEDLESYVERQLNALAPRLPAFRLLKKDKTTVDKQPAITFDTTWQTADGKMFQRQVTLHTAKNVLIIAGTCRGDHFKSKWESMFNEFLAGFHLRQS